MPTGVPAFLGFVQPPELPDGPPPWRAWRLTRWLQFTDQFRAPEPYLAEAVYGFFANGGRLCYILPLSEEARVNDDKRWSFERLEPRLADLAALDQIDLVSVPGLMSSAVETVLNVQQRILAHCDELHNRFAILDAWKDASAEDVRKNQREALRGDYGALYYPWIGIEPLKTSGGAARLSAAPLDFVPPCGHIAGSYARSDEQVGVHKAPANLALEKVLSLQGDPITDQAQAGLNNAHINCLRSFPRRGIRAWGARSLSSDPKRRYINVLRLLSTMTRWLERELAETAFEPNNPQLWAQIEWRLREYCRELMQQGAFAGAPTGEAFTIACNAETNPEERRAAGEVTALISLAPTQPGEVIQVRIIHGRRGVTRVGPGHVHATELT